MQPINYRPLYISVANHSYNRDRSGLIDMAGRRPGDTENLVSLPHLNEDILLNELKARYKKDDIYVRTCM